MSVSELTALPDDILGKETRQRYNDAIAAFTELNRRGFVVTFAGFSFKSLHSPETKPITLRIVKQTVLEL